MLSFFLYQPWDRNYFLSWNSFFSCGRLALMLDCNGFEGLHQYRYSFIYRNLLVWWHFRLAARHFTDSSLKRSFFLISWTEFGVRRKFGFFCFTFFRLFMKAKCSSRNSSFFSWWLPIPFTPTPAFLFTSERGFTFSLNCSILPKNAIGTKSSKRSKFEFFWKIRWDFSNKN